MYRVRQEDLPFQGSSHQFVGADNGDVGISAFLLSAMPGKGPGPHRHPYDEVQFVREGVAMGLVGAATGLIAFSIPDEPNDADAGDVALVYGGISFGRVRLGN